MDEAIKALGVIQSNQCFIYIYFSPSSLCVGGSKEIIENQNFSLQLHMVLYSFVYEFDLNLFFLFGRGGGSFF